MSSASSSPDVVGALDVTDVYLKREVDTQLDLFALPCEEVESEAEPAPPAPGVSSELLALLSGIDPDVLTPREALQQLYELKRLSA